MFENVSVLEYHRFFEDIYYRCPQYSVRTAECLTIDIQGNRGNRTMENHKQSMKEIPQLTRKYVFLDRSRIPERGLFKVGVYRKDKYKRDFSTGSKGNHLPGSGFHYTLSYNKRRWENFAQKKISNFSRTKYYLQKRSILYSQEDLKAFLRLKE